MSGQQSDMGFPNVRPAARAAGGSKSEWTKEQARNMKPGRKNFSIEVTADDIATATQNSSSHCVVAEAVHRSIPGASRIDVDMKTVRFTLDGKRRLYLCPDTVSAYVIQFDAGEKVEPFRFDLSKPVAVRSYARTPKGNAVQAAERKLERAERAAAAASSDIGAKRPGRKVTTVAAARADLDAAKALPGLIKPKVSDGRKEPPRTFKEGRVFGMKKLRINNQAKHIADLAGRLASVGLELIDNPDR